jgi:DNA polymerase-1
LVQGKEEIQTLLDTLLQHTEICFDTETTNIDANEADLVGLSFSVKKAEGFYIACPADRNATQAILDQLAPLFNATNINWVGQNLKYDMLVLKWYNKEIKGNIFDTMLAHYLIEPEGRRSMDLLSAQYLTLRTRAH